MVLYVRDLSLVSMVVWSHGLLKQPQTSMTLKFLLRVARFTRTILMGHTCYVVYRTKLLLHPFLLPLKKMGYH